MGEDKEKRKGPGQLGWFARNVSARLAKHSETGKLEGTIDVVNPQTRFAEAVSMTLMEGKIVRVDDMGTPIARATTLEPVED